jgi:glycine hydroxymethyltransferase
MVPYDSRSPFKTSGIRVGSPAVTTRGLKEHDMETIVTLIDEELSHVDDQTVIERVKKRVKELMGGLPLYAW